MESGACIDRSNCGRSRTTSAAKYDVPDSATAHKSSRRESGRRSGPIPSRRSAPFVGVGLGLLPALYLAAQGLGRGDCFFASSRRCRRRCGAARRCGHMESRGAPHHISTPSTDSSASARVSRRQAGPAAAGSLTSRRRGWHAQNATFIQGRRRSGNRRARAGCSWPTGRIFRPT